ncbi:MAG: sulfatase [Acidimicrobiales bacterium]|nr:sulfatase [Acidimicrobiales bacterium]
MLPPPTRAAGGANIDTEPGSTPTSDADDEAAELPATSGPTGEVRSALRQELSSSAELAALLGFAVVQPVLGPFGQSPETFVAVGAAPGDIIGFALLVAVVPVVAVVGVASATRALGAPARRAVQTGLVGCLVAVAATTIVRHVGGGPAVRVILALAAAVGVAVAHRRWAPVRLLLRCGSATPLVLTAVFLLASPVAPLVRPGASGVETSGQAEDLPPVLMIVLDELPTRSLMDGRGGVDADLFPNLARLAGTSTWYRNHTTVGSRTAVAVPAITTGRYPPEGSERPAVAAEYPDSVFSLLAPTHDIQAVEWATKLCPQALCPDEARPLDADASSLLSSPVGEREDPVAALLGEARSLWWGQAWPTATPSRADYAVAGAEDAAEMARPGLEFLSGLVESSSDRPGFHYLHVPLPHQPWQLLPSGDHYNGPHPAVGSEFAGWAAGDQGEQLGQAARARHILQLQWADRLLGAIFDRLEDLGQWDDAVVVVTADHGVAFGPAQQTRELLPANEIDIAWTPLFIKSAGQVEPDVVDGNVLSIDIVPTLADLVGVEVGWDADGTSLLGRPRATQVKTSEARRTGDFEEVDEHGRVELEADGLAALLATGRHPEGPDPLRAWRHGRNGELIGRAVAEVGVCAAGPPATYEPPGSWSAYVRGTLDRGAEPLPLWHEGTVDIDGSIDIAVAVAGTVVGWNVSRPSNDGNQIGVLLAQPLVEGIDEVPLLYQVIDGDGCRLAPLRT